MIPSFREKLRYIAIFMAFCSSGYFLTGNCPIFPLIHLPYSSIDAQIPYLPWTVLVYISYYPLMIVPMLCCNELRLLRFQFRVYMLNSAVSLMIFVFWPIPLPEYDVSAYQDVFTQYLRALLVAVDSPLNTCPSLHVAVGITGALCYLWYNQYRKGMLFTIWGILVSLSTLTAKRHFFIDVAGGILLALIMVAVAHCWEKNAAAIPATQS